MASIRVRVERRCILVRRRSLEFCRVCVGNSLSLRHSSHRHSRWSHFTIQLTAHAQPTVFQNNKQASKRNKLVFLNKTRKKPSRAYFNAAFQLSCYYISNDRMNTLNYFNSCHILPRTNTPGMHRSDRGMLTADAVWPANYNWT